ncbi:MAG: NAD-dependent epimerase/dehydratase family protein, partial [Bdellovibrionales bacterium]
MPKCVAITGSNGFIGSYLVRFFLEKKWIVRPISKSDFDLKVYAEKLSNLNSNNVNLQAASTRMFEGVDVLIHCAYQKQENLSL